MKNLKNTVRTFAFLIAVLVVVSAFASCSEKEDGSEIKNDVKWQNYDTEKLDSYIKPFEYVGLKVSAAEGKSAAELIWEKIVSGVQIVSYPEAQVEYYAGQERLKYKYYAERDKIDYDKLLESLGVTEEVIYNTAKGLVKEDLAFEYIVKDAKISLTDAEKEEHFGKYAEKFVQTYGYNKEYVTENMKDQIYDAMLYDKTMEYLILNNSVSDT